MTTFVLDPLVNLTASEPRSSRQFQRKQYKDRLFKGGESEWRKKLDESSTVYVGNLSCYTKEDQLHALFSRCGSIKRIIMGLDKFKKTPCGFCFVEFDDHQSAMDSIHLLDRTQLDVRELQIDIDAGFEEGRQFGRGAGGGQISDERRRERDQDLQGPQTFRGGPSGGGGAGTLLTRSITIIACMTMISLLLIASQPALTQSTYDFRITRSNSHNHYSNLNQIRRAQASEYRAQFEKSFAQSLVNLMKTAKPSLLKAFIQATLADKQLKEIAIGMFFNNTGSNDPTAR